MSEASLIQQAARSAYYAAILKAAFQFLSLIATIQLVRALSAEDYGVYNLIAATIPLLQVVASFGLLNVLQRYLPEFIHQGEHSAARRLVRNVALMRVAISSIALAVVLIGWSEIAPLVKIEPYKQYFWFFTIAILAFQQWGIFKVALESEFAHRQTMLLLAVSAAVRVVGYFIAARAANPLLTVLAVDTVSYLFLAGTHYWLYVRRRPPLERSDGPIPTPRRQLVRYGVLSHFNDAGVQMLDTGVDNLFLAYFMDLTSVATYTFSTELARKLARLSPVSYVAEVIRPLVFAKGAALPRERLNAATNFVVKLNFVYFIPLLFAAILIGREVIDAVFGKYEQFYLIVVAVLAFTALNEVGFAIGLVAQLRERVDILLYSKLIGIYNLVADIILIPKYGVMGAVVATGTAALFKNAFIWWFLRKEFSIAAGLRQSGKCLLFWSLWAAGLAVALAPLPGLERIAAGVAGFIAGFVVYLLVGYRASADELAILSPLLHRHAALRGLYRHLEKHQVDRLD